MAYSAHSLYVGATLTPITTTYTSSSSSFPSSFAVAPIYGVLSFDSLTFSLRLDF